MTRNFLPANVRLNTVNDVVCRLLGAPSNKKDLDSRDHPGAWYVTQPDGVVEMEHYKGTPSMIGVTIHKVDYKICGQKCFGFSYHFEFGGMYNGGSRGIMMRSYAINIALLKRLADFFGGVVDYCDCDSKELDHVVVDLDDDYNCPEDGVPWQNLQERIWDLQPLTQEEIDACEKVAAYKETDEERADRRAGGKKEQSPRYTVVNEDGINFWVMDNDSQRRLRPTNGSDAWHSEEVAKDHADRLNRKALRK